MKKILIIDDEAMLRRTFQDFLEDYDFEVITARDGEEGLARFHDEQPDALLVDLNMPKIDGFGVLEVVHTEAPETPIVVISGVGVVNDAIRAVQLGAWDYITKPIIDLQLIIYTLDKVFERERLIRENREYKENLEKKVALRTNQLQQANQSLQRTQRQIVRVLGRAGEYRDNETGKHVIRVSKYCKLVATVLGLPKNQADLIERTSPLHDIGKIGIPDSILLKPGPLDDAEWNIMRKHCEYGFHILSASSLDDKCIQEKLNAVQNNANSLSLDDELNLLKRIDTLNHIVSTYTEKTDDDNKQAEQLFGMARTIALYHHEKWDGTGYPMGLKGEDIPIEARITALADIYDALGSDRSYKKSFPEEKCQAIIRELSGTHLDANVVDAFFNAIEKILKIKKEWKD